MNDLNEVTVQYQNASNLDARIALHQLFSINKYGWYKWLFDEYKLPANCRILELGCGSAAFWVDNLTRISSGWNVTLTDFSSGMLEAAKRNLPNAPFMFKQVDAQEIPFEAESFDVVIANHMLYHVPNRPKALAEIRRVLKPTGRFFAATNGDNHLKEIHELVKAAYPDQYGEIDFNFIDFRLENGLDELRPFFSKVDMHTYEDALVVTDVEPLVNYILSMWGTEDVTPLRRLIGDQILQNGAVHIQKSTGLFICEP